MSSEDNHIIDELPNGVKNEFLYPDLMIRVKAMLADFVFILILIFAIGTCFDKMQDVSDKMRMIAFIFAFVLYDPICVSFLGGTIGHFMMGLKVRRYSNQNKKVFILVALIRYAIKVVLGAISFLTVSANSEKRAIHDMFTNTIVLYKKPK